VRNTDSNNPCIESLDPHSFSIKFINLHIFNLNATFYLFINLSNIFFHKEIEFYLNN
jgi:hypothetical protein